MDFWRKKGTPKCLFRLFPEEVIVNISHITSSLSLCRFLLTKQVKIVHDHLYLDCHTQPWVILLTSIVENSKDTLVKNPHSRLMNLYTDDSVWPSFTALMPLRVIFYFMLLFVLTLYLLIITAENSSYFLNHIFIFWDSHGCKFYCSQKCNFGVFPLSGDLEKGTGPDTERRKGEMDPGAKNICSSRHSSDDLYFVNTNV